MGYHLNCLDELVFMAGPKPMQTEFGIHQRLESCVLFSPLLTNFPFFSKRNVIMLLCVIILPSATLKAHKTSEFHSPPVGDKEKKIIFLEL